MTNSQKIEQYMIALNLSFEEIEPSVWLIDDSDKTLEHVAVILTDNLVTIRCALMREPSEKKEEFFRLLLNLNAADLIHGAYALDGDEVILIDSLECETMDFEEFQASLDAFSLAMLNHYKILSQYRNN